MSHEIFEHNPTLEKVYVTSDNQPFYKENDAKNHGKTLKDKAVETVYNPNLLAVDSPEDVSEELNQLKTGGDETLTDVNANPDGSKNVLNTEEQTPATEKEFVAKALVEFNPETAKYQEALKLFKALGLEAENEKKETIYPLLVAEKAKVQEGVNTQE